MKSILIRNIDPRTLSSLKHLARAHHRSLQGELHAILEHAVSTVASMPEGENLDLVTVKTGGKASWKREEIYGNQGR